MQKRAKQTSPRTTEVKHNPAQNALKHGLRLEEFGLVHGETADAFDAFEAGILKVYRPRDDVERHFVDTIVIAMWREMRTDRIEAQILRNFPSDGIKHNRGWTFATDGDHVVSLNTLLRYRSQAQMELKRAIKMLEEHRKAERAAADDNFCTNEVPAADEAAPEPSTPPANENCTNEIPPPEASPPISSPTPSPTPRGEGAGGRLPAAEQQEKRGSQPLSQQPSPHFCTNEQAPEPPTKPRVIVHRKEPVPSHHKYWWK